MDQVANHVSSLVDSLEELRLPVVPFMSYVKTLVVGIPIAVLLHETSEYWLPKNTYIPIVSWFVRRWRAQPERKETDLRVIRNVFIVAFFVVLRMDTAANDPVKPSDYVEQRVSNSTAQRTVNEEIYKARGRAFGTADAVLGEEEMDMTSVQQQRDAVLRRRHNQQIRSNK